MPSASPSTNAGRLPYRARRAHPRGEATPSSQSTVSQRPIGCHSGWVSEPVEDLRDAYIALGSAISELRSSPTRNYSHDEEALRITGAQRSISEAEALLARAGVDIEVGVRPHQLRGARGIGRPVVWGWIASLGESRNAIAANLVARGQPVPDDLPEGSALERLATSEVGQRFGTAAFVAVVLGLIAAAVVGAVV